MVFNENQEMIFNGNRIENIENISYSERVRLGAIPVQIKLNKTDNSHEQNTERTEQEEERNQAYFYEQVKHILSLEENNVFNESQLLLIYSLICEGGTASELAHKKSVFHNMAYNGRRSRSAELATISHVTISNLRQEVRQKYQHYYPNELITKIRQLHEVPNENDDDDFF